MNRQTAITANSRVRLWNSFVAGALVIGGLMVTATVTWLNVSNSYRIWELASIAEAEQLSESLRYRVLRNREPLIAISTLYSGSDDVTQTELETARAQILAITGLNVNHLIAFVSDPDAGGASYRLEQVAGDLFSVPTTTGQPLDNRLVPAIKAAVDNPGQLVLGALIRNEHSSYLPITITAYNATQPGTLLYLMDFSQLLRVVTEDVLGPGVTFSLLHPETGDINHAAMPTLDTAAEAQHRISIDMGLYDWQLDWSFDTDAGAGIDHRLSYAIALGGTAITLLVGIIIFNLLHQGQIIQQQIQRKSRELEEAQTMLIQREKMAALGKMVAGISHELNTPIGNSLLAATLLRTRSKDLAEALTDDSDRFTEHDRREAIDTFVNVATESTRLIEKNIQRATELIRSFKQVAVDQSSERRRHFNLADTLQELAHTLGPSLRAEKLLLTLEVPASINMDSYPGALYQVISNLVSNAMAHAYPDQAQDGGVSFGYRGELLLEVTDIDKEQIVMQFSDDGAGIDEAVRDRIFDPFFTTRMGSGGSGLGLHIVFTLVSEVLGGTIKLVATNKGTRFRITLPLSAP